MSDASEDLTPEELALLGELDTPDVAEMTIKDISAAIEAGEMTAEEAFAAEMKRPEGDRRQGVTSMVDKDEVIEAAEEAVEAPPLAVPQTNPDPNGYRHPSSKFH